MKAQLTFLSIFMKVLLLLLILAFCFTGSPEKESACNETKQSSRLFSIKDVTDALLHSVHLQRFY